MATPTKPTLRPIIQTHDCKTAEELLEYLSPATSPLWRRTGYLGDEAWLFRGHANGSDGAAWPLLPSAHRGTDVFVQFMPGQITMPPLPGLEQRQEEHRWVMAFAGTVDEQGLTVPGDSHELRDSRARMPDPTPDATNFPPPNLVAMYALAQHHGVPTRLLDWTVKPLVAAYFAAEPVARLREPRDHKPGEPLPWAKECPYFSVFALSRQVFSACVGQDPDVVHLSVPTATNANLHAQGGQFTLVRPGTNPGEHPLPAIDEVLQRHEAGIRLQWSDRAFPLLVELRTPTKEARTVMTTLRAMGVSGASVFPGLGGVVRAMREARCYQWASPENRREA